MKCAFRYEKAETLGFDRVRHGAPCPNVAKHRNPDGTAVCWLHRHDLAERVRAQKNEALLVRSIAFILGGG